MELQVMKLMERETMLLGRMLLEQLKIFQMETNQGINARPTLQSPLPWLAMAKACLSLLRLSSSAIVCCRRCAAALAPGPSCASLSSRQSPWLRTTATLKPLLISPMIFPSKPGSCPCALPIAATLDSAKSLKAGEDGGIDHPKVLLLTDLQRAHQSF